MTSFVFGQNNSFIEEKPITSIGFNPSELTSFVEISTQPGIVQAIPIEMGDITTNIVGDILQFNLPGYGLCYYVIERIDNHGGGWAFSGRNPNGSGYFIFVDMPEGKGGYFVVDNRTFIIFPAKNGYGVILESEIIDIGDNGCFINDSSSADSTPAHHECEEAFDDCPAVVKVAVLVTPEAQSFFTSLGNPFAATIVAYYSMYAINGAFIQSNIANKEVEIVETISFDMSLSGIPNVDIDALSSDEVANDIRLDNHADLVIMLTPDIYDGITGTSIGIGPCPGCYWGIVEAPSLFQPTWTFAHEVGHLLGARHNSVDNSNSPSGDSGGEVCQHGLQFNDAGGVQRFTMMAIFPTNERILHFSNPSVAFMGTPTGTTEPDDDGIIANNARILSQRICDVANYFDDELDVVIDGQDCVAPGDPTPYYAEVLSPSSGVPGQPPYNYIWRFSPLSSNGPYFDFSPPETEDFLIINDDLYNMPFFWLELEVTSSDGIIAYAHKKVDVEPCIEFDGGVVIERQKGEAMTSKEKLSSSFPNSFTVYPNPNLGIINLIDLPNLGVGKREVSISNIYGEVVFNRKLNLGVNSSFYFDNKDKGLYLIRVIVGTEIYTSRFIMQ